MRLRRNQAGSTSLGHTWHLAGQVLDVPDGDAAELLAIPDGGFSPAIPDGGFSPAIPDGGFSPAGHDDASKPRPEPVEEPAAEPEPDLEVTEPAPAEVHAVDEAPKPRRGRPPKAKE